MAERQHTNTLFFTNHNADRPGIIVTAYVRSDTPEDIHGVMQRLRQAVQNWCQNTYDGQETKKSKSKKPEGRITIVDVAEHSQDTLLPFLREQGILEFETATCDLRHAFSLWQDLSIEHGNIHAFTIK